jgi:phytoene dehydrogenase-like protein
LDLPALDLRPFDPGALIRFGGRFHRIKDPWREPLTALTTLFSPVGTLADKWRMALLRKQLLALDIDEIYSRPETTIGCRLHELGFSKTIIERFFRPFFSGVFFDQTLSVSSRAFEFCFRTFAAGDTAVPAAGMGAIPYQIADALPLGTIRTNARVSAIRTDGAMLESGEHIPGKAVVVATDGQASAQLLGEEPIPSGRNTTCMYFAAKKSPIDKPILLLDADGDGPINSLVVPSLLSQHYAPSGQSLIAVNVSGMPEQSDEELEKAVRTQLQSWFDDAVEGWQHLKTFRISNALPSQTPPVDNPRNFNPRRAEWLYLCGEYGNAPTINWALYSGRRAAESIVS